MSEELKRYKEKREAREKETAAILGKDPTGHPYDNDACLRCGYTPPQLQKFEPLKLDWEPLGSLSLKAKERGYLFLVHDQPKGGFQTAEVKIPGLKVMVKKDGKEIYRQEGIANQTAAEFVIHKWYTNRLDQYLALKQEFEHYNLEGY